MDFYLGAPRKIPKLPMTPRQRVLTQHHAEMEQLQKESSILEFTTTGKPPDKYRIIFHGKCLIPKPDGEVVLGDSQEVELSVGMEYPRVMPHVRWISQIVHPNIFNNGVCFGNFASRWTPYFHLTDMAEILWDYSRLAILNPLSAGPGASNQRLSYEQLDKKFNFPVDRRPLRNKLVGKDEGSSAVRPVGSQEDIVILDDPEKC